MGKVAWINLIACHTVYHSSTTLLQKIHLLTLGHCSKKRKKNLSIGYQIKLVGKLCRWWVPVPFQDPQWSIFSGFSQFIIPTHTLFCLHLPEFLLTYQRAHKSKGDKFVSQFKRQYVTSFQPGDRLICVFRERKKYAGLFLFPSCIKYGLLAWFSPCNVFFFLWMMGFLKEKSKVCLKKALLDGNYRIWFPM